MWRIHDVIRYDTRSIRKGGGDDKGTLEMSGRVGARELKLLRRLPPLYLDRASFVATNVLHKPD